MNAILRPLLLLTLAVMLAPVAAAQGGGDEPVRLRLSLDPDGRVRLSTDSEPVLLPSPQLAPQPLPGLTARQRPVWGGVSLVIEAGQPDGGLPAPCLINDSLHLRRLHGCEPVTWVGLPGAIASEGGVVLRLERPDLGVGFDLNYGLGWLATGNRLADAGAWMGLGQLQEAATATLLPGWIGPALGKLEPGRHLGLATYLWLGQQLRLDLAFGHSEGLGDWLRTGNDPGLLPWLPGSENSLSFGIGWGRFQGAVTGRQWRPDLIPGIGPLRGQESLDLGFSWRMPWNAELEFGARNLIVRPQRPDPAKPDQGDLRTPYIRYHQEL